MREPAANPDQSVASVLVYVGFDRVGDGLLKLPFVQGLRRAFPEARITWLAGREDSVYAGVMAGPVRGLIDEIIENAGVGLSPMELLQGRPTGALAGRRFDLIVDTQRIFWTSLSLWRVPHGTFISPAARFLLSAKKPRPGYRFPKTMQRQMLDLLELASGLDFPTPKALQLDIDAELREAAARLLPEGREYLGIAPGSGGPPKCWPLENFIAVARGRQALGRTPVFLLGPKEAGWRDRIAKAVPKALFPLQDAATQRAFGFSPFLTIALAARLGLALSNDSGAGHMLAVGGAPVVILYGPTRPDKFQPMTERLVTLHAHDFGGSDMHRIPVAAVETALDKVRV
jgi:ADP-heptose:LPS heptosyltransferase